MRCSSETSFVRNYCMADAPVSPHYRETRRPCERAFNACGAAINMIRVYCPCSSRWHVESAPYNHGAAPRRYWHLETSGHASCSAVANAAMVSRRNLRERSWQSGTGEAGRPRKSDDNFLGGWFCPARSWTSSRGKTARRLRSVPTAWNSRQIRVPCDATKLISSAVKKPNGTATGLHSTSDDHPCACHNDR
jgi:hypothetical protein